MLRVFIETTIPSFYFETRTDRRSQDWRAQTRLWWDNYRRAYSLVTSDFVIAEYLNAPAAKSGRTDWFFEDVIRLELRGELLRVIDYYIAEELMPSDAAGDAAHLAMASIHGVEFLLIPAQLRDSLFFGFGPSSRAD